MIVGVIISGETKKKKYKKNKLRRKSRKRRRFKVRVLEHSVPL